MSPKDADTPAPHNTARTDASGCFFKAQGAFLILTSLIGIAACGVILTVLDSATRDHLEPGQLSATARWCFDHKVLIALTCLPTLACGVLLLGSWKRRTLVLIVGSVAFLFPFGTILYCLFAVLAPLYQYQPL